MNKKEYLIKKGLLPAIDLKIWIINVDWGGVRINECTVCEVNAGKQIEYPNGEIKHTVNYLYQDEYFDIKRTAQIITEDNYGEISWNGVKCIATLDKELAQKLYENELQEQRSYEQINKELDIAAKEHENAIKKIKAKYPNLIVRDGRFSGPTA